MRLENNATAGAVVRMPRAVCRLRDGQREGQGLEGFADDKKEIKPVFKRWSRQRMAPEIYNGGFEDMESMGAVYSRISSLSILLSSATYKNFSKRA